MGFLLFLKIFVSVLIPALLGYSVISALFGMSKVHRGFAVAIAYGLGMGLLAQWMLLLGFMGLSLCWSTIALPLTVFSLILLVIAKRRKGPSVSENEAAQEVLTFDSPFQKCVTGLLFVFIFFQIFCVFWHAFNVPIYSWDAVFIIAMKAKVFFYENNLNQLANLKQLSYPLQVPFFLTWTAFNLGYWDDLWVKAPFPFLYVSYLFIQYYFVRSFVNGWWALLSLGLFCSVNFPGFHAGIAYRDFTLMYYNTVTLLFLIMGCERDTRYFILAGLFAGFSTFTKMEATGFLLVQLVFFALLLWMQPRGKVHFKRKACIQFVAVSVGISSLFYLYKFVHHLDLTPKHMDTSFSADYLARMPDIWMVFFEELFFSNNWNIIWVLLLASLYAHRDKIKTCQIVKYLGLALLLFFGLYMSVALLTESYHYLGGRHTYMEISRINLHFFPLCPLLIIFLNSTREARKPSR